MTATAGTTALVVVDMQSLFVDQVGPQGARVLSEVNALISAALDSGAAVIYTRDPDPEDGLAGTVHADLHPDLLVRGPVVLKGPGAGGVFSGFVLVARDAPLGGGCLSTLAAQLRDAGADHVVVAGLAGDVCVSATAIDARRLGYTVTLPLRATAFVGAHPAGDEGAVAHLRAAGVVIDDTPPTRDIGRGERAP